MEFLLGRGLLGSDEKLEIKLLLTALEKRPQCVGFLGQAWGFDLSAGSRVPA